MKVFLTGATGFVGSRVLAQLLRAGHQITTLVRTPEAADILKAKGIEPVLGGLESLDIIAKSAQDADAVVHLAFIHDFTKYAHANQVDASFSNTVNKAFAGELS